jgi:hypothetical protein
MGGHHQGPVMMQAWLDLNASLAAPSKAAAITNSGPPFSEMFDIRGDWMP